MSIFRTEDLPRSFFEARGRGFHGTFIRNPATGDGSNFVLYNPPAAALAAQKRLLVTKLTVAVGNEGSGVTLQHSSDTAALDALTNVLAAANHAPNLFDGVLDTVTKVAIESHTFAPTITGSFWRTDMGTAAVGGQAETLDCEYPLIIPPGVALVVLFQNAVVGADRFDKLNAAWFRA